MRLPIHALLNCLPQDRHMRRPGLTFFDGAASAASILSSKKSHDCEIDKSLDGDDDGDVH